MLNDTPIQFFKNVLKEVVKDEKERNEFFDIMINHIDYFIMRLRQIDYNNIYNDDFICYHTDIHLNLISSCSLQEYKFLIQGVNDFNRLLIYFAYFHLYDYHVFASNHLDNKRYQQKSIEIASHDIFRFLHKYLPTDIMQGIFIFNNYPFNITTLDHIILNKYPFIKYIYDDINQLMFELLYDEKLLKKNA